MLRKVAFRYTLSVQGVELMNVKETAELLGLSPGRVRQLAQAGTIPAEKIGRDWVFIRRDVDEFANKHRRPGRPSKEGS